MKQVENIRLNGETYSVTPTFDNNKDLIAVLTIGGILIGDDLLNKPIKEVVRLIVSQDAVFPDFILTVDNPFYFAGHGTDSTISINYTDIYNNAPESKKIEVDAWTLTWNQQDEIHTLTGGPGLPTADEINTFVSSYGIYNSLDPVILMVELKTKPIIDKLDPRYPYANTALIITKSITLYVANPFYVIQSNTPKTIEEINNEFQAASAKDFFGKTKFYSFILSKSHIYIITPKSYIGSITDASGCNALSGFTLMGEILIKKPNYGEFQLWGAEDVLEYINYQEYIFPIINVNLIENSTHLIN